MTEASGVRGGGGAYRTIGEVAEELHVPQHVLRFWETRFPEIAPLKRAGGRRLYRPEDIALLRAVQTLLYADGYTIKGVQKLLAEFGATHMADALARSARHPAVREIGAATPDAASPRLGNGDREPAASRLPSAPVPIGTAPPCEGGEANPDVAGPLKAALDDLT